MFPGHSGLTQTMQHRSHTCHLRCSHIYLAAANAKPHKDYAVAKQPYYKKRVEIFEQYYQREQEKVEKAKTDNKQIKVLAPL